MSKLLEQINKGESKTLEFKAALPSGAGLAKSAVAFSNMAGGLILIGVEDGSGIITGLTDEQLFSYPDRIANTLSDACFPVIIPELFTECINKKMILGIRIHPGALKPYYLKNRGKADGTYIRVGATDKPADTEMIQELERQRLNISFDEQPYFPQNHGTLDLERLNEDFFKFTGKPLTEQKMFGLKLLSGDRNKPVPTLGGLLISGKDNPLEYARIKCARFKGITTKEFIDQKEFSGPLYEQVENTMAFARVYIPKAGIVKKIQRIDTDAVPVEAVREAVVNAVVHRDYSISGADIKFAVFDNRIEITSPGALPKSLVIEDIIGGRSEIRNRVIARFFRQINFIEQWGTGIGKIISLCRENHLKPPEFVESGLFFKVIIYNKPARRDSSRKVPRKFPESSRKVPGKFPESSQKVPRKFPESSQKVPRKFPESSRRILELLSQDNRMTIKQMADALGISDRTVKNQIKALKDKGRLVRVGPDRGGYWEVTKD